MSAVHGEDAAGKCEEKASREVTSLQLAAIWYGCCGCGPASQLISYHVK